MLENSAVRLFISYSHKDESLREKLGDHLAQMQREGLIAAWHDRQITAGQEWAGEISANLEAADIILCLVSAGFLASPYCQDKELKRALERHEAGDAVVIPVIVRDAAWHSSPLGRLQALPEGGKAVTSWSNKDKAYTTIAEGIRKVALQLAERPDPQPDPSEATAENGSVAAADDSPGSSSGLPRPVQPPQNQTPANPPPPLPLDNPEGPVRHDSPFYIAPPEEGRCCAELDKPGALIRIKGPRGFGKLSFTARLLAYARGRGYRTVALNLIGTDRKFFADPERFMQWFCAAVGKELDMRVRKEEYWSEDLGPNDNGNDYFENYLLKPDSSPLVLAIDNFDRIFAHGEIETDFCGLLRSWHERARIKPLWERFRLVISHSQEPYLAKDINQSPFNVGVPVELSELSAEQVRYLVGLHGLSLSDSELGQLRELVGGHPYLIRKALYELANGLAFATLVREAATESGIYIDHLRGILKAVDDHPELGGALRQLVSSPEPVKLRSQEAFKLESLGVAVPEGNGERPRCRLYATYLADRLAG